MQQVLVNIDNKELEEKLLEEAHRKGKKLAGIILEALENNFLRKKTHRLHFRKLNPLKHMSGIDYKIDENVDLTDAYPFDDIEDSAAYVQRLRKNAWRG